MSEKTVCRWGFLGGASIAQKNWNAIFQSGNGVVSAVASRSKERAEKFIEDCQAEIPFDEKPTAFGDYQEMIDSDQVDAVYIPLPTGLRKQWVIAAAKAGKHVMCEKPCAVSADDLREMVEACSEAGVQFMDGVMYMHNQRLKILGKALKDQEKFGLLRRVAGQFSFRADDDFFENNIRASRELEPQGCLGDLGWYLIRLAMFANDWKMPTRITASQISPAGEPFEKPPIDFQFQLYFPSDIEGEEVTSQFFCSFKTHHQQWMHFAGTNGTARIDDFVLPFEGDQLRFQTNQCDFEVNGTSFVMKHWQQDHLTEEPSESRSGSQECKLFHRFNEIVTSGELDEFWPNVSMRTQIVLDCCQQAAINGGEVHLEYSEV